ncbi:hypothetical protein KC315_g14650, partial [Hortaea werneckii]
MQYALIFAAAALAHAHENRHGRLHANRDINTVTDLDMVTVTQYVTATAAPTPEVQHKAQWGYQGPASSKESSSPSTVASSTSVAPQSYSSVEEAPVQESSAKPSTTFATSAASPSAYSSAASPSSYGSGSSTTSSSSSSGTGITANNLTPNGKKAGLSGYVGIQEMQAFSELAPYISWYSDYAPDTPD